MVKILLADDHAVVRQGVKHILMEAFDPAMIVEAGTIAETLDQVRIRRWDIVVLDITMHGRNTVGSFKDIREVSPKLPILVFSMHPEEELGVRVLKAGAAGYLTKECSATDLVAAIRKVLGGGRYISTSLAELLVMNVQRKVDKLPHQSLSDRKYEILCLIATGKSTAHIAEKLSLSIHTINTHRAHILEKMNMKTTAQLIQYAFLHRLVDSNSSLM